MIGQVLPEESENGIKFRNNIKFWKGYYSLFLSKSDKCSFKIVSYKMLVIQPDFSSLNTDQQGVRLSVLTL